MKSKVNIAILCFLLIACITNSYAATSDNVNPKKQSIDRMTDEQKKVRLEEIRVRVNEIKEMDRSTLSRTERKTIKKELREMRKESREMKGGIYLSVGAIIIIILVLILIL